MSKSQAPLNQPANGIIAQKATMVVQQGGFSQKAAALNFSAVLAFITQLFQGLAKCGGAGGNPVTPAQVHGLISNPTRREERVAERLARQNFRGDPVAQEMVLHGTYEVGSQTTEAEAVAMYQQANGRPPG